MPGPVHAIVAPVVVELAFSTMKVLVQVRFAAGAMLMFGKVLAALIVTLAVLLHPLAGSVTVAVYVPAWLTVGVNVVLPDTMPGPVHAIVAPVVVELAFSTMEVLVQVRFAAGAMLMFGKMEGFPMISMVSLDSE